MPDFHYVYTLESLGDCEHFYVGLTDDLATRLAKHNAGGVPHTAKHRPWRIKTAVACRDRARASDFERYLKSPSGRAFAICHVQQPDPMATRFSLIGTAPLPGARRPKRRRQLDPAWRSIM